MRSPHSRRHDHSRVPVHGLEAAQACITDSAKAYGKSVVLAAYSLMWRGRLQEDGVEMVDTGGDPRTFRGQRRGDAWVVAPASSPAGLEASAMRRRLFDC